MIDRDHPLDGMCILVADDEILIAACLEDTLRSAGADIISASTVSMAIKGITSSTLSAAILDVRMGRETTEAVADLLADRHVPFVFYSGHALPDEMQAKFCNVPVLLKPYNQEELVDVLFHVAKY